MTQPSKVALLTVGVCAASVLAVVLLSQMEGVPIQTQLWWDDGRARINLEVRGNVEFADDDHDVARVSDGGCFELEQRSGGVVRRYVVRQGSAGGSTGLDRRYSVGGSSKPFDDEAREWLARVLPQVIRETAAGAEGRVRRIMRQRGSEGVLAEIRKIRSDHSRSVYLQHLLEESSLTTDDLMESMRLARRVDSDGERANLLIAVMARFQAPIVRESYFDAVDSMSSDGERERILSAVLEYYGTDRETVALVLRSAGQLSSDGEKANVLVQAAVYPLGDGTARANFFRAAGSISSDGERRRVLSSVLEKNGADRDVLLRVLRSASGISSDSERAEILSEAAAVYVDDPAVRRAFFGAAGGISSDGERRRALSTLAERAPRVETMIELLKSAAGISSDGEKAEILANLKDAVFQDPTATAAFLSAADTISSDGERGRVLMAALSGPMLAKEVILGIIHSAQKISSDGEKGRVLVGVAEKYSSDRTIASALRMAAQTISSDGEYRRLMSML